MAPAETIAACARRSRVRAAIPSAGAILAAGAVAAAGPDTKAAGPDFEAAGPGFEAAGSDKGNNININFHAPHKGGAPHKGAAPHKGGAPHKEGAPHNSWGLVTYLGHGFLFGALLHICGFVTYWVSA